ncbi:MAG: bifunctional phosphoribosylaminoimidazolecarboxamide formyltransferase/IMP cyclohydrolase [Clostridia bacterium]|nr:bifunctional phosphoribosylaminoimidazolecarboxamide formyltransferase/IMP cyclohydrolase [Clostridia bacterium]
MKKRALVSVSDKTGVVDFCKGLVKNGFEIISTGGTAKALKDAGLKVIGISEITGFPECLDGRVKTLHPNVHAGLLAMRSNPEHMAQLEKLNINTIDIVCVNLYPFKATLAKGADFAECIENIDIGGPTMIRAAAKNYQDVAVIVDPNDYQKVLNELANGGVTLETKKYLQYKVFAHTAVYDSLISNYLASQLGITFPDEVTFAYEKAQDMRYGENPQQQAVFYKEQFPRKGSLSTAKQLWGKELSYNNINDANGALELLKEFGNTPAVVACKHANPCGVGTGTSVHEAYMRAYESDPVSVFGGILAINGTVDEETATEINKIFIEIVMAPAYTEKALEILEQKKNIRLLQIEEITARRENTAFDMKKVYGGLLVQQYDESLIKGEDLSLFKTKAAVETSTLPSGKQKTVYGCGVVTNRAPTDEEIEALLFNWKVVKHTKSNAIVIGKKGRTTGIGMGQTNRIWAAQQAIAHAGEEAKGSVMASDAFFPFPDCVEECVKAGITAIIQPGGSIQDKASVEACNAANIAMVFVGDRHFKH